MLHIVSFKDVYLYSKDKDKQKQIREQAILKVQEKEAEQCKAKAARVQQEKKYALETMMKVYKCVYSHIYCFYTVIMHIALTVLVSYLEPLCYIQKITRICMHISL